MHPILPLLFGLGSKLLTSSDALDTLSGARKQRQKQAFQLDIAKATLSTAQSVAQGLYSEHQQTRRAQLQTEVQRHAITQQAQLFREQQQEQHRREMAHLQAVEHHNARLHEAECDDLRLYTQLLQTSIQSGDPAMLQHVQHDPLFAERHLARRDAFQPLPAPKRAALTGFTGARSFFPDDDDDL